MQNEKEALEEAMRLSNEAFKEEQAKEKEEYPSCQDMAELGEEASLGRRSPPRHLRGHDSSSHPWAEESEVLGGGRELHGHPQRRDGTISPPGGGETSTTSRGPVAQENELKEAKEKEQKQDQETEKQERR